MKGFDYTQGKEVNDRVSFWEGIARREKAAGGFVREDRELGETFIHGKNAMIVAEIYRVNLKFAKEN